MDIRERFGRRLRDLRTDRGLSQAVLAERAEMTPEYVSRLERGIAGPSLGAVARLARSLGVEPAALFDFGAAHPASDAAVTRLAYLAATASGEDRRLLVRLAETVLGRDQRRGRGRAGS